MATSPNFNWPEPDNTDLVKNGALAIRTAVNAIDTSLVDLKGGTTGQVLAKASGTDMDFSWVAQDDTNAIQNAIVDAKGDIIVATAADTPARLAVGTNGQVLKANSATATGLEWSADSAGMTNPMTTTGDTIYSSSGSTPARLGIGSTGQILTVAGGVPSWATPAGGGGMTLINTFSMSAVSALNMDSIFSSTYSRYRVLIYTTQSVADWINLRLRVSGSDNTTSSYYGSNIRRTGGSNTGTDATATTGWSKFMFAGQKLSTISFDIMNPFSSSLNTVTTSTFGAQETADVEVVTGTSYGLFNANTSFDGLSLISTGTMTGQVKVYGYPE